MEEYVQKILKDTTEYTYMNWCPEVWKMIQLR